MANQSASLREEAIRLLSDQEYEKSLTVFDFLVRQYEVPQDRVWLGLLQLLNGDFYGATIEFSAAVAELPQDLSCHHHLAAIRSSCPVSELRDAPLAMEHAEKVADIRQKHSWRSLSVLGACHAENGDFEIAISRTREAIRICHMAYRERLRTRIEAYKLAIPYRMCLSDLRAAAEICEHHCTICGQLKFVIWEQASADYIPLCLDCATVCDESQLARR